MCNSEQEVSVMASRRLLQKTFCLAFVAGVAFSGMSIGADTLKPVVSGKRGVVAAGHPLAAEAGLRILEKGGNAVDAGVATVFAASVVEMTSFGTGGECPMLTETLTTVTLTTA
jgi:gamma-glutamyltranspeptidase